MTLDPTPKRRSVLHEKERGKRREAEQDKRVHEHARYSGGVQVAWGFTEDGERVLVAVSSGMRESFEDWQALGSDLISRGLGAPILIVADGAPGLIKAIEQCWPAADRQRCCVHRARNLYAKIPDRELPRPPPTQMAKHGPCSTS